MCMLHSPLHRSYIKCVTRPDLRGVPLKYHTNFGNKTILVFEKYLLYVCITRLHPR